MIKPKSKQCPKQPFKFSRFIAIDWSGAKGNQHPGIQAAQCFPGNRCPETIQPPKGHHWSRSAILTWLQESIRNNNERCLVGIDFAFAHPYRDQCSYYPGWLDAPTTPITLWETIDHLNHNQDDYYGGAIFTHHPAIGAYYLSPANHHPKHYQSRRRLTEIMARQQGRSPSITFKAIGPDNVATGSLAGMRCLHHLKASQDSERIAIWPFDTVNPLQPPSLVLVEIFPSLYFHTVGLPPHKKRAADPQFLNQALSAWHSLGVNAHFVPRGRDADEADAILSAAALRTLASNPSSWQYPLEAKQEGWIFGVLKPSNSTKNERSNHPD